MEGNDKYRNFALEVKTITTMTATQLNTMNTELWQSIGAIADSEPLMRRLTRYAKKLLKEREADPTLLTKEEFLRSLDEGEEQYRQGKTHTISSPEQLREFLASL